jgi:hypothetical protein
MGRACGTYGVEKWDGVFVGKPKGTRPLLRPERIWADNIKMDLQEIWWAVYWIYVTQDKDKFRAFVNIVVNLRYV